MTLHYLLGIDTGGTYTDAVLYSETQGILAKAKALTTRHDLAIGIAEALDKVIEASGVSVEAIGLVSLSTTLATNALVEGQGGRAGLVMIGFGPDDLKRDGLSDALGSDPVIYLAGGHDVHGTETPLDLAPLEKALPELSRTVSSFAIAGYFAVRNPSHEDRVRDFIRAHCPLPVTCSHELSSKLGGPRRALTTLLNARLVSMIDRLVGACEDFLTRRGIDAPLMVVRGDGALISAAEARLRPIETSVGLASPAGARHLTGAPCRRSDIAVRPPMWPSPKVARLDADGAVVGGYRTMVEAVAMRTYGLGGDSEVRIDDRSMNARIDLGPRRLVPLSLAATLYGRPVIDILERQLRAAHMGRHDGRLTVRTGVPDHLAAGLAAQEAALFARIGSGPVALDQLMTATSQLATLDRLVARGLVHICGITPSDAMHVLGRQDQWDREAADLGLRLAIRRKNGAGQPIAASPEDLAQRIVDRLTRQSAEVILSAVLPEAGLTDVDPARSLLIDHALRRQAGIVRFALSLDRPLVGLGASAPVYYPAIGDMLSVACEVPADADVANAVGAVVGRVRATVTVFVTAPEDGIFMLSGAGDGRRFTDEEKAFEAARDRAGEAALEHARQNGAADAVLALVEEIDAPEIDGSRKLVEARFIATASGRPRLAHG